MAWAVKNQLTIAAGCCEDGVLEDYKRLHLV